MSPVPARQDGSTARDEKRQGCVLQRAVPDSLQSTLRTNKVKQQSWMTAFSLSNSLKLFHSVEIQTSYQGISDNSRPVVVREDLGC